jgi:tetratricopeptide (TPR) repeat protein
MNSNMARLADKQMPQAVAIEQIKQVIRRKVPNDLPAFTFILGSGASFGSVPTAKQMLGLSSPGIPIHPKAIPLHLHQCDSGGTTAPSDPAAVVREFWRSFKAHNPALVRGASDPTDKLPDGTAKITFTPDELPSIDSIAAAYQAVFAQHRCGGINTPDQARAYLREVTLPAGEQIRLNGTHFFLASLLSLQNRGSASGLHDQSSYIGCRPFARTIFTTNFDPLLQVSLQLFQLLYYMTDRPEQLAADALQTDHHTAIHLFYAHGSVHRPFLANSDSEIAHLRERNAQNLAGYLGQHGVIVLGYSGWDDCLLRALKQTPSFANNLYWLARDESSISPEVQQFLESCPNAYWVKISDGGQWMAELHRQLCPGYPFTELLKNPIPVLRRRLEQVALESIKVEAPVPRSEGSPTKEQAAQGNDPVEPEALRKQVIDLLRTAEKQFERRDRAEDPRAQFATILHQADLAYGNNNWADASALYTQIIDHGKEAVDVASYALALFRRGYCHGVVGDSVKAIADYSACIQLPGAPAEQVAKALFIRGFHHGEAGDLARAIDDYSACIQLPGAPAEQVARALVNRGYCHGQAGDSTKAIADYTACIQLPGAPAEQVARALFNRGNSHGKAGSSTKAIDDYTACIQLPGAPADQLAMAFNNRGFRHAQTGDLAKAIDDYTACIQLPGAPAEQVAWALCNRGFCYGQAGDSAKAVDDYTACIQLPGVPTEITERAEEALKALGQPSPVVTKPRKKRTRSSRPQNP